MQRLWPFIWVGLVVAAWFASPWLVQWSVGVDGEVGTFGDSFGALTSLFTGLAFVGLIITLRQQKAQIAMQREDLKLQRGEMKAARAELSGQKEQMELQNQSLKQQMFEQTFFNLLNVFNQYIADLVENGSTYSQLPKTGRDQLQQILSWVSGHNTRVGTGQFEIGQLGRKIEKERPLTKDEQYKLTASQFQLQWKLHANDLSSYFRLLYNVLKLVDQSSVRDKKAYANILRAQLSDSELQLIALNCARSETVKLQVLVERYDILKHLPPKLGAMDIQAVCDKMRRQEIEEQES